MFAIVICLLHYILSSVYSPFSDRAGLPPHNAPLFRGVNEEYWSSVFYDRMPLLTSTTCVECSVK